jgi:hypothetical protein
VRTLYARIQQDRRHQQIVTIGEGPEPERRFTDWTMGFGQVALPALEPVLNLEPSRSVAPDVDEHHIQTLLRAFGVG